MLDALALEEAEGSALGAAAPSFRAVAHPNRRLVAPLWHGDGCDGLSSLFATLNGIRLAVADRHTWTAPEAHALMKAGLRFTDGRLTAQQLILAGVRVQLWRQLAEGVVQAAQRLTGIRIRIERLHDFDPRTKAATFESLRSTVAAIRVPLVLLQGGHYTVVSGVTASSILLFDSADRCWITKRTCGVPLDRDGARHVLFPASFMALSA